MLSSFSPIIPVWLHKASSSTSRDSICTTRTSASENYCETLSEIQRSDQMLSPFSPVIPVWIHKASSSTNWDSIGTTRKTGSGNYCETVSAIQRSDQMLSPFSPLIPVWLHKASSSTSRDSVTVSKVHEVHASAGWPKQGLRVLAAMPSVGEIVSADLCG